MARQFSFNLYQGNQGGRRPGAGRKRLHSKGVAHRLRERVNKRTPLHVNIKYLSTIKNKLALTILKRAIFNARKKGLKIIHYSLQSNHLHLILEVVDNETLERGMRSLTVTLAKGFKRGKIQIERYHLHVLRSLRETRNAVLYVLFNQQRHSGGKIIRLDSYSTLAALSNWRQLARRAKLTVMVKPAHFLVPDPAMCFLLKKALAEYG